MKITAITPVECVLMTTLNGDASTTYMRSIRDGEIVWERQWGTSWELEYAPEYDELEAAYQLHVSKADMLEGRNPINY
jgi:hypothetical protein